LRIAIVRTARRLRQQAEVGLPPALVGALGTVRRHGPLTPSELAELEGIKRPTATVMIARMEQQDLVTRERDPDDGRSCRVAITPQGRALLASVRGRKNAYLARGLEKLDADELATLDRALELLEQMLAQDR
jgi:DNA-binding MarR family transcriptional regulator